MDEVGVLVKIKEVVQQTTTMRGMTLELPAGREFDFLPGQHLEVRLCGPEQRELEGLWNAFSISSSPLRRGTLEICVSRRGLFARELFDLPVGSTLEVRGPLGSFVYGGGGGGEPVFIAGGIGITPIMSMLRYLGDLEFPAPALLFHSCRTFEEIPFYAQICEIEQRWGNFTPLFTITRSSPSGWKGENRRLDRAMLADRIADPKEKSYYICGPQEMMLMLTYYLMDMGVRRERISTELW